MSQGIEVYRLDRELHASFGPHVLQRTNSAAEKLGTYRRITNHTAGLHEVPLGSYIIFLNQPQRQNVLTLFEPANLSKQAGRARRGRAALRRRRLDAADADGRRSAGVMAIKETAAERRFTLIRDPNEVRKDLALPLANGNSSPIASPLRTPVRIALYKSWTGNMDEGWTRFVFDTFNVPYTSLTDNDMRQGDLGGKYDVIVLPSQRAREITDGNAANSYPVEFTGGITAAGVTKLKEFVTAGGTLICFDASCEFPSSNSACR